MSYTMRSDCDCVYEEMNSSIKHMRHVLNDICKYYHTNDIDKLKTVYQNNKKIVECLEFYLENVSDKNDLKSLFRNIRNQVN